MKNTNKGKGGQIQVLIVAAFWIGFCVAIAFFGDGGLKNKKRAKTITDPKITIQDLKPMP